MEKRCALQMFQRRQMVVSCPVDSHLGSTSQEEADVLPS